MNAPHPDHDRLMELLADRALFGLNSDDQQEVNNLLSKMPNVDT